MNVRSCPECGKHNLENAWNCDECGATLPVNTLINTTTGQQLPPKTVVTKDITYKASGASKGRKKHNYLERKTNQQKEESRRYGLILVFLFILFRLTWYIEDNFPQIKSIYNDQFNYQTPTPTPHECPALAINFTYEKQQHNVIAKKIVRRYEDYSCEMITEKELLASLEQLEQAYGKDAVSYVINTENLDRNPIFIEYARPKQVSTQHIQEFQSLYSNNQTKSEEEIEQEIESLTEEIGKDGLKWLVRYTPIYNSETNDVQFLGEYLEETAVDSFDGNYDADNPPRIVSDPIGVSVDLFFGDYDEQDIIDWLDIAP